MIVVDTSILVYAVGMDHPHADPSRRLFDAVTAGRVAATTIVEAVQEFAHAFARRRPRAEAASHARRYARVLSPLLETDAAQLDLALDLLERYEAVDAFDALLAAAAMTSDAEALVSADTGFSSIPGLTHISPGSRSYEQLLAS